MQKDKIVKNKIEKLINLMLTGGVQPSDLADNIFLNDYLSIKYEKKNGQVIGSVVFEEDMNFKKNVTTLRYYYDENKKIVKIEEIINRRKTIVWDRYEKEQIIICEILDLMKEIYTDNQIGKFISTLPITLQENLKNCMKKNIS